MFFRSFSAALCFLVFVHWIDEIQAHAITRSQSFSSASLVRRARSGVSDYAAERKGLLAKYSKKISHGSHATRQSTIQEDMVNQNMDIMYYATLEVGTPPQQYAVILGKFPNAYRLPKSVWPHSRLLRLDTGSSDLWLQSVDCAPCTGKKIDPSSSSSLHDSSTPFSITYGIGTVKGTLVNDVVSIGSAFTVQNQVFGLVNYTLGTPVPGDIVGLMGLGFKVSKSCLQGDLFSKLARMQNLAVSQAMPFWEALVSNGQWSVPVMSFWMTR